MLDGLLGRTTRNRLSTVSRFAMCIAILLVISGCIHLGLYLATGTTWHGPLSLRKPILFGISGGMTAFSIAWLMTHLRPQWADRLVVNSVSFALLVEVALITMQYWRGVASHFNHSTRFDESLEFTMIVLILYVTGVIIYLTVRTIWLRELDPSMAFTIRTGMALLALSCGLGIATTALGEASLSAGKSPEFFGKAGVLKFPHGAALHAIQLLPFVAWLGVRLDVKSRLRAVQAAFASQVLFLIYAVWQTSQGRDRFDWDTIGASILGATILTGLITVLELSRGCVDYVYRKPRLMSSFDRGSEND